MIYTMFKLLKSILINLESIARDLRYMVVYLQKQEASQRSTLKKMEK